MHISLTSYFKFYHRSSYNLLLRFISIIIVPMILLLSSTNCGGGLEILFDGPDKQNQEDIILLDHITINPINPSVPLASYLQFTATAHYSDNSTQDITSSASWDSSETAIATINSSGHAETFFIGTTVITAEYDGQSANTVLTVSNKVLDHITISPTNPSVALGIDQQFTATAHYSDTSTLDVTASTLWNSSNTSVAIINAMGLAESISEGTTTITADYNGETANTTLTVSAKILDHITISPTNPSVALGIDQQFTATAHYSDESTQNVTGSTSWNSSNTAVATINGSGLAESLSEGTTTITANYSGETANTVLTVTAKVVDYITISPTNPSIGLGTDPQFTATAHYTDTTTLDVTGSTSWTSSNTAVATIDASGLAGTLTQGTTTITADYTGLIATTVLTVAPPVLDRISINQKNRTITLGTNLTYTGTAIYSDGSTQALGGFGNPNATWTSSDTSVATIIKVWSNVQANSQSAGTTTITAEYGGKTDSTSLTVTPPELDYITISPTNPTVPEDFFQQFTATAHYTDSSTADVTDLTSWSSSNTSVATIDASGMAQTYTAGTTTITAVYNGKSRTTVLTAIIESVSWPLSLANGRQENILSVTTDSYDCIIITGYARGRADFNGDGDTNDGIAESTFYGVVNTMSGMPNSDAFIAKYTSQGTLLWAKRLGSSEADRGNSVTTDSSDNIIVTGHINGDVSADLNGDGDNTDGTDETTGYGGANDIFISKFNSSGTFLWAIRRGGSGTDGGDSVATDPSGNILFAGEVYRFADLNGDRDMNDGWAENTYAGTDDIIVAKYSSSGSLIWAKRLGGADSDHAGGVASDSSGNVIFVGGVFDSGYLDGDRTLNRPFETSGLGAGDAFISKFSSSGTFLWGKRLSGWSADNARSVATDASDNVIVTGYVQAEDRADLNGDGDMNDGPAETDYGVTGSDVFITKFTSGGSHIWAKRLKSESNAHGESVATDASGNIIVTGYTHARIDLNGDGDYSDGAKESTSLGGSDIFISKFSSSGTFRWAKRLGGNNGDRGLGVAADSSGYIITVGYENYTSPNIWQSFCDGFIYVHSSSGVLQQ